MTPDATPPVRVTWLVPDDVGGGIISVAHECCRQAAQAGHVTTLLLALPLTGRVPESGGVRIQSLGAQQPFTDIPGRLVRWLAENPQDVLVLNGCEQADVAIPYVPASTRLVYVVHDTAGRYFAAALRYEPELDAIVAVSRTVAGRFRERLRDPDKLRIILNGTTFPGLPEAVAAADRADDLIFLGGGKPIKGAFDALTLWNVLLKKGFRGKLHWFDEVDPALSQAISRTAASERVVVHGRQPRHVVFETASRSKVMLMLSREEPFGMATVECMGMGCLPVAWDIPTGTKEIVAEGDGAFAPLGKFEPLADAVFRALERHPFLCRQSTLRIRSEFGEGPMWSRYEAVILDVLSRAPEIRTFEGQLPPEYRYPIRLFQLIPSGDTHCGTSAANDSRKGRSARPRYG